MSERLQKYLARAGIGSRRFCEALIKEGKVTLNGNVAKIGATVSDHDVIEFEGKTVDVKATDLKVILLNKPEGVLSSNAREKKIPFFNLGPDNDWKRILDKDQQTKLTDIFKEDLIELGYK